MEKVRFSGTSTTGTAFPRTFFRPCNSHSPQDFARRPRRLEFLAVVWEGDANQKFDKPPPEGYRA